MTKADLIGKLAGRMNWSLRDAERVVDTIFDAIMHNLAHDREPGVEIRGFGSFRVRRRRARQGRNPQTGTGVHVPAKSVPFFKPGKELKAVIAGQASGNGTTPAKGPAHGSAGEGRLPAAPDPHDPSL
jgi:integration host factor subunit beta